LICKGCGSTIFEYGKELYGLDGLIATMGGKCPQCKRILEKLNIGDIVITVKSHLIGPSQYPANPSRSREKEMRWKRIAERQ